MRAILEPFWRAETYSRLLFLVSALPLGIASFVLLVTGWPVTLVLAITPLVAPLLLGLRLTVGQVARAEGALARRLLGVDVDPPRRSRGGGFWRSALNALVDPVFWKQQAYLVLRFVVGMPFAIVQLSVLAAALWAIGMPIHYRAFDDTDLVERRVDTLLEALAFVPVGLLVLLAAVHLIRPLSAIWRLIASTLLCREVEPVRTSAEVRARRRRVLAISAATAAAVSLLLVFIWALTTRGYFWPIHGILPLALVLAIASWIAYVLERPDLERRAAGSRALAFQIGISAVLFVYLVLIWLQDPKYFWPAWVLLGLAVAAGAHAAIVLLRREYRRSHRIEELEETRAGAIDVQETELRRIERDLHDGAQARLVALGMSIGMAEEKLRTDPEGAQALLAAARGDARQALEELRNLARGIHPPILTDRGLEAAVAALASRGPVPVTLSLELARRPPAAVETATYFLVAEALANAIKHAGATRIEIRVRKRNETLVAEVEDDGQGGADPAGHGLRGLEQRVRALDGTLHVESPAGGPTTVRAELPCA